jgi:protein-ribulosamine 3-kinase
MIDWFDIEQQIYANCGIRHDIRCLSRASGGGINDCYILGGSAQRVFVKINLARLFYMFEAEATGLTELHNTGSIAVPDVLCTGVSGKHSFIVLQVITFCSTPVNTTSYQNFGRQLAALHRHHKHYFGSECDNTIGSTPQVNKSMNNWLEFWSEQRLGFQLRLAREKEGSARMIEDGFRLAELSGALFSDPPDSSCLHGDLWQGNWGFDQSGDAVIFDPAHYYGDRETDLAMTQLFGQAPNDFYAAYQEAYPFNSGYAVRTTFYNIYHILNHYNIFGGSYANQAHRMILSVLSEIR